jgi:hypothetical protein
MSDEVNAVKEEPSNVIQFPKRETDRPKEPSTELEVKTNVDRIKILHVEETLAYIVPFLIERMIQGGFQINTTDNLMNITLVVESIRSMLYAYYSFEHPLHHTTNTLFKQENGMVSWNDGTSGPIVFSSEELFYDEDEDE